MKINQAGIEIIKRFEGLETQAYPDPGTHGEPWTIGYGHTSSAGTPHVRRGMKITGFDAETILKRDIDLFANGVRSLIKVPLTDNQFSAIVSFAFNLGLGGLRKSSVLKAINSGDFKSVPRRLNLYRRAGPRILSGLVKRRAAEGALFMMSGDHMGVAGIEGYTPTRDEIAEMRAYRVCDVDKVVPTSLASSTTVWSAVAGGAAGMYQWGKDMLREGHELTQLAGLDIGPIVNIAVVAIIVTATGWVIWQRWKIKHNDGV